MNQYLAHQISKLNPKVKKEVSYNSFILVICCSLLTIAGLITLYSANHFYYLSQLKHVVLGVSIFIGIAWWIPLRVIQSLSFWIHGGLFLSLCLVLLFGYSAGGAKRWLLVGSLFRFQPSEFIKISMVLSLATFFYNQKLKFEYYFSDVWPILLNVCLVFLVIFFQPDFGTAGLCLGISLCQIAFIRVRITRLSFKIIIFFSITTPVLGWFFLLKPYQKLRIINLLNPERDPTGSGYNSLQSLVAIGSGQIWGKGFMQGSQTQLHFLPARHTDFIFSVFSEEFGFMGCGVIFLLFFILFYVGFSIARESNDLFKKLTAIGLTSFLFLEFFINIAMILGIFPVVGMPLPFFSYGGSSVITISLAMGLLISIDRNNRKSYKDILQRG